MDREFEKVEDKLPELSKKEVLDEYWRAVSRAIEDTWLEHLEVDKEIAKKMGGRGEVKITKVVPNAITKQTKKNTIRNAYMYKVIDNLKQARRCEQISHRIMRGKDAEEEKRKNMRS